MFRLSVDDAAGTRGTAVRHGLTVGNVRHAAVEREGAFRLPASLLRRIMLYAFGTYVLGVVPLLLRGLPRKVGFHLRDRRGVSLIEVVLAVAILGLVGPAFLMAVQTGYRTQDIIQAQLQAQNLAQAQLEDVRNQVYLDSYVVSVPLPAGYSLTLDTQEFCHPEPCDTDNNIQKNTVKVTRGGRPILAVSDLKMRR